MTKRLTVRGPVTQRDIDKLMELTNENQFGRNEAYYKLQRYENLEEEGRIKIIPQCAILVEQDYKGCYERYALTPEEFRNDFERFLDNMLPPTTITEGNIYTIRPGVHLWYQQTIIGSPEWDEFFTDMSSGLPDSDINDGNLAHVEYEYMNELIGEVRKTIYKHKHKENKRWK